MSQPPELGCNLSTISRKQAGASMVAKILNKQKWVKHTKISGDISRRHYPLRCLRFRLGGKFSGNGGTRSLDTRGKCDVNKRKRIKDDTIRHPNARQKISKLKYKDLYRQYDSVEVHNKSGRNSLLSPARDSRTDTECMQPIQPYNKVQPYSGDLQHKGRSVESDKKEVSIIRSLPPEVSIFVDQPTHGPVKDRCLRSSSQPEAETILKLPARSRNDSSRCFSTNLAKNGTLPIPSLAVNTESHTKVTSVKNQESSSDHPTMANPILVPNGVKNEAHSATNDSPIKPKLEGNRMALINNSWKNFGLNLETSQFLAKATRASTHKAYNNGWNRWATWCSEQTPTINPEEYNTKNILEYLMQHNHLSYQYLNGLRSAIASVFKHIHPTQPAIASQPEIVTFFKAKRDSEIRIPQWHQLETWDINILMVYIRSNLSPTSGLDLLSLQLKVMLLMCINTMWRPRSDIGRIQFRDVNLKFKQESYSKGISNIEGVILHIRHPKESQVKTTQVSVVKDAEICLVSALVPFLKLTTGYQKTLPIDHTLFLGYLDMPDKAPKPVRPATVANWIQQAMKDAGVDDAFKAHSIRLASSTKAVMNGSSIDQDKEHANWSLRSNTFEKHYYKPTMKLKASSKIQESIFSSSENGITLEVGTESTGIVLGTTNNTNVDEVKTENVIHTRPWYRKFF